mmetsp:Transcript_68625/g.121232  ORF Transcript_68625/g.121232 Transcript_68625/m.121232 type:complete len:151 (-) Transcript_68625:2023-2475(-)
MELLKAILLEPGIIIVDALILLCGTQPGWPICWVEERLRLIPAPSCFRLISAPSSRSSGISPSSAGTIDPRIANREVLLICEFDDRWLLRGDDFDSRSLAELKPDGENGRPTMSDSGASDDIPEPRGDLMTPPLAMLLEFCGPVISMGVK